jgi:hypothetical protein
VRSAIPPSYPRVALKREAGALDENTSKVVEADQVSTETTSPVNNPSVPHTVFGYLLQIPRRAILVLLLSFSFSFLLVLVAGLSAHKFQLGIRFSKILPASIDPIPDAISVNQSGVVVHVPHFDALNPDSTEDWLMLNWIKLKKGIVPDERVVLSAKYDPSSKVRPGFSLALRGGIDGIRPMVYWQNEAGDGRWFTFAPFQLQSKEWYLLGLSFRRGTLGMHAVSATSPKSVLPLGGYDVGEGVLPLNSSELIVGSFANGRFRGKLGPFGVIKGKKLGKILPDMLKQAARAPGTIPDPQENGQVILWTDGSKDYGLSHVEVRTVSPASRGKGDE